MLGSLNVSRSRLSWWIVGLLLGGAIAFVIYSFIGTVVFGLFFYYATRPVYRRLKSHVGPPSLAAAISITTLALPFVLLLAYTTAIGLQELEAFTSQLDSTSGTLGQVQTVLAPYFDVSSIAQDPSTLLQDSAGREVLQTILVDSQQYLFFIGNMLLHLFVMAALAFYLLKDGTKLSRWFRSTFSDDRGVLEAYMRAVDRDFSSIFFGNILNAFATGVIGTLSYSILNIYAPPEVAIPYAALVGLLAGAASLIPVVGMKLVYVPVGISLLVRGVTSEASGVLWFPVAFFAVSFVIVDVIPDLVLRPYVSGRNLHVGTVMFAYILGPLLFGWYGLFLGPILLILSVHFARLVLPELLHSERLQPYAVDPTYFEPQPLPEHGDADTQPTRGSNDDVLDAEATTITDEPTGGDSTEHATTGSATAADEAGGGARDDEAGGGARDDEAGGGARDDEAGGGARDDEASGSSTGDGTDRAATDDTSNAPDSPNEDV